MGLSERYIKNVCTIACRCPVSFTTHWNRCNVPRKIIFVPSTGNVHAWTAKRPKYRSVWLLLFWEMSIDFWRLYLLCYVSTHCSAAYSFNTGYLTTWHGVKSHCIVWLPFWAKSVICPIKATAQASHFCYVWSRAILYVISRFWLRKFASQTFDDLLMQPSHFLPPGLLHHHSSTSGHICSCI